MSLLPAPTVRASRAGHSAAKTVRIAQLAVQAAKSEAATSPKPGLVCPDTQGAHKDMDIELMFASAASLEPYFRQAAEHGLSTAGLAPAKAFPGLRALGVKAEQTMLRATGGVNTHKGLVFSLGLLTAASGRHLALGLPLKARMLCATAAQFIKGITAADFAPLLTLRDQLQINTAKFAENIRAITALPADYLNNKYTPNNFPPRLQTADKITGSATNGARINDHDANAPDCADYTDWTDREKRTDCTDGASRALTEAEDILRRKLTAGERLFLLYGVSGIRGEAESGFPHLLEAKKLFDALAAKHPLNTAAVNSLLLLMSSTDDTNVLHRGGPSALARLKRESALALRAGGLTNERGRALVNALGRTCLELYISPGGCADLLALIFYLHFLEKNHACPA